jgi:hypothetical protein
LMVETDGQQEEITKSTQVVLGHVLM